MNTFAVNVFVMILPNGVVITASESDQKSNLPGS